MTASCRKFTQEFKDELCREVISTSKPIKGVATAYGVGPETLRNWFIKRGLVDDQAAGLSDALDGLAGHTLVSGRRRGAL